jgi:hypothetical protein
MRNAIPACFTCIMLIALLALRATPYLYDM